MKFSNKDFLGLVGCTLFLKKQNGKFSTTIEELKLNSEVSPLKACWTTWTGP